MHISIFHTGCHSLNRCQLRIEQHGIYFFLYLSKFSTHRKRPGNIAAGATTRGQTLSERDQWLCEQVGPELRARGLLFVGIDVIGDYITEINVTSPTCIRELDRDFDINISADLFECIELRLSA